MFTIPFFVLKGLIKVLIPVCFIGCSLDEVVHLKPLIGDCQVLRKVLESVSGEKAPTWFMLVDDECVVPDYVRESGITVVKYERETTDYLGLDKILEEWATSSRLIIPSAFGASIYNKPGSL